MHENNDNFQSITLGVDWKERTLPRSSMGLSVFFAVNMLIYLELIMYYQRGKFGEWRLNNIMGNSLINNKNNFNYRIIDHCHRFCWNDYVVPLRTSWAILFTYFFPSFIVGFCYYSVIILLLFCYYSVIILSCLSYSDSEILCFLNFIARLYVYIDV